ncbi:MAG: hypothetical protein ABW185_08065 [Sedimenticola sp.]
MKKKDKGVECTICNFWYHIECQSVSIEMYNFLRLDKKLHWYCACCNGSVAKIYTSVTALHRQNEQLEKHLDEVQTSVESCGNKIDTQGNALDEIKNELISLREDIPSLVQKRVHSALEERSERVRREDFIMFFNVPESAETERSDRIKEDTAYIIKLCENDLGAEGVCASISDCVRIGKQDSGGRPLPLKVRMPTREVRAQIFKNAYKLAKNPDEKKQKIAISRDLTQQQREENRNSLEELRRKRIEYPEDTWGRRRNEVVKLPRKSAPVPATQATPVPFQ